MYRARSLALLLASRKQVRKFPAVTSNTKSSATILACFRSQITRATNPKSPRGHTDFLKLLPLHPRVFRSARAMHSQYKSPRSVAALTPPLIAVAAFRRTEAIAPCNPNPGPTTNALASGSRPSAIHVRAMAPAVFALRWRECGTTLWQCWYEYSWGGYE